jgi:hypothetical protein
MNIVSRGLGNLSWNVARSHINITWSNYCVIILSKLIIKLSLIVYLIRVCMLTFAHVSLAARWGLLHFEAFPFLCHAISAGITPTGFSRDIVASLPSC